MKTEKMNLWQRCEALGPMEDQGVALAKHKGVWIMYIDGQQVFFAYEDGTINDICRAWLADAILQRFEAITNQGGTATELPTPENLPEPTYIVESPKEFVSIPVGEYFDAKASIEQVGQAIKRLQSIFVIEPVEFES
jgi:hypothetical protein